MRDAYEAIYISCLVLNGQTYWLDRYGHYKAGFWHGVHYCFQGWLKETLDSKDARRIVNAPEVSAVIGKFVEGMIDY